MFVKLFWRAGCLAASCAAFALTAQGQTVVSTSAPITDQVQPPAGAPPVSSVAGLTIPALTPVRIELLATVNSKSSKIGEHFPIRLAAPIALADGQVVPAGILGSGDVVHAAKSRFGGKPGELIIAARYLDWNGVRIPLRSLAYLPGRGLDNTDTAMAVAMASTLLSVFITGGEVNIPAGTIVSAKTAAAVVLLSSAAVPAAAGPASKPSDIATPGTESSKKEGSL